MHNTLAITTFFFAGANCTDPSRIIFLVPGSEWIDDGGEWKLVGCPARFYLDDSPQCSLCPAGFYCSGGRFPPTPCGVSKFTPPGANTPLACKTSVSVLITVNVPVLRFQFDETTSSKLGRALSLMVNKSLDHFIVKAAEQSDNGESTIVVSTISAENDLDADFVAQQLNIESVQAALESHGLKGSALLSVQMTSCLPGHELDSSQTCQLCLEKHFCVGGTNRRESCPAGSYSLAGANSSSACFKVVFVVFVLSIPLSKENLTNSVKARVLMSVVNVARVPAERVIIGSLKAQGSRAAAGSTILEVEVATDNAQSAAAVAGRIGSSNDLNSQLIMQGLPAGSLESITVTESVQSSDQNSLLWIIIVILLIALALISLFIFRVLRQNGSLEERSLQNAVNDLLLRLKVTPQNGFILSSKSALFLRSGNLTIVQKSHAEAAARLSMLMDFDPNQFDAFCLCLEGEIGGFSISSLKNLSLKRTQQYDLLCEWILEIGTFLMRPEEVEPHSAHHRATGGTDLKTALRVEQRFPFLVQKVLKVRVWEDSEYSLFRRLQVVFPWTEKSTPASALLPVTLMSSIAA